MTLQLWCKLKTLAKFVRWVVENWTNMERCRRCSRAKSEARTISWRIKSQPETHSKRIVNYVLAWFQLQLKFEKPHFSPGINLKIL